MLLGRHRPGVEPGDDPDAVLAKAERVARDLLEVGLAVGDADPGKHLQDVRRHLRDRWEAGRVVAQRGVDGDARRGHPVQQLRGGGGAVAHVPEVAHRCHPRRQLSPQVPGDHLVEGCRARRTRPLQAPPLARESTVGDEVHMAVDEAGEKGPGDVEDGHALRQWLISPMLLLVRHRG